MKPERPTLSEVLYRTSLEASGQWFMFLGPGLEQSPPYLNIGQLSGFVEGFRAANAEARDEGFFTWLRDEAGAFPGDGWTREFLRRANGSHELAIRLLFDQLHRFLLETRPAWFVRFNLEPQESLFANGLGEARSDVRLRDHVLAVAGTEPISPPQIRLLAFEMTDGYVMMIGLPQDVGSWWGGSGRRIGVFGSPEALSAVRGSRKPLDEVLAEAQRHVEAQGACALEATAEGVTLLSRGSGGAIHIRAGALVASSTDGALMNWSMQPGDRVLLLTSPLFARAMKSGLGPLPSSLATGEPIAWAQSVETAERRLAVAVSWPG